MLDGVTVLSQEIYKVATAGFGPGVIVVLAVGIIIILVGLISAISECDGSILIVSILFSLFPFALTAVIYSVDGPPIEYVKYNVIVDDTVSFNEFTERYTILSQNGLIYEIIEKEADSN